MASTDPYVEAAALKVVEQLHKLRGLTFEQASALPSAESADITIAGSSASLTTFRYIDVYKLDGKVLVVVLAAKPMRWGIGARHIERGLVFSSDNSVRAATETELQNSGG